MVSLRFGAFLLPEHDPRESPTISLRADLDTVVHLDRLGLHEVWVGEHHSAGWSPLSSPELFLAAAAERTSRIMLGAGVVALPYHHPLMVANRMIQVDHQSRGRVMLGVGAGVSVMDGHMVGVTAQNRQRRMAQALEAVLSLLRCDKPVTMRTDWFDLVDATVQLRPYSEPCFEIATATGRSDNSIRLAARHDLSALSFARRPGQPGDPLPQLWAAAEEEAARHGTTMDRSRWRVAVSMHLAETRAEAVRHTSAGMSRWYQDYFVKILGNTANLPEGRELEASIEAGTVIVGSVEDAIEGIERLLDDSGGFGTLLVIDQNWAGHASTKRSYELIARYVMPHFSGATRALSASAEHTRAVRARQASQAAGPATRPVLTVT